MSPAKAQVVGYRSASLLGRRFRSLKLWFAMHELAQAVGADPRFEPMAPVPFSVVCFRYKGTDDENRRLLESANARGEFLLSHTALRGR